MSYLEFAKNQVLGVVNKVIEMAPLPLVMKMVGTTG